jgi:uncharacterized lipoprotein
MKKELLTALLEVQKELPMITRDTKAYNYKYAPLEVIWEKVGKILTEKGFVVVNELTPEGVKTTAYHEAGELSSFFAITGLKPQDKGAEATYGRRYNLVAIFNIQLENEDKDCADVKELKKVNDISSL